MKPDITLQDVINHMSGMEQRLGAKIEANAQKIDANARKIEANADKIDQIHVSLVNLTQDVQAIGSDMYQIKHNFVPKTAKRLTRLEKN